MKSKIIISILLILLIIVCLCNYKYSIELEKNKHEINRLNQKITSLKEDLNLYKRGE